MTEPQNSLKICVILKPPADKINEAVSIAIKERVDNAGTLEVEADALENMTARNEVSPEMAVMVRKLWRNGRTLRVRFLDGEPTIQAKVVRWAKEWEKYANITFDFGNHREAEIRITFRDKGKAYSAVGTDALLSNVGATMNFGWFDQNTEESEFERTVMHEFGHALGCIHEHQSPSSGICWKEQAVLDFFRRNGWDEATTRHNVLEKESPLNTNFTTFDRDSIMLYPFPGELTCDGRGTPFNNTLSETDKNFMRQMYPRVAAAAREPVMS